MVSSRTFDGRLQLLEYVPRVLAWTTGRHHVRLTGAEMTAGMHLPEVVSPEEWLAARRDLLVKEKEATRARDRVNGPAAAADGAHRRADRPG